MAINSSSGERGVVVWSRGRDLLRVFRPQAWVVLQDLAFDAEWFDGSSDRVEFGSTGC